MKIVPDEDLSAVLKYTQHMAKELAEKEAEKIVNFLLDKFIYDEKFRELNYSGLMTFLITLNTHFFCRLFSFTLYVGSKFPDTEHCGREIFEEAIQALRLMLTMPEINRKEHADGIKKISTNQVEIK